MPDERAPADAPDIVERLRMYSGDPHETWRDGTFEQNDADQWEGLMLEAAAEIERLRAPTARPEEAEREELAAWCDEKASALDRNHYNRDYLEIQIKKYRAIAALLRRPVAAVHAPHAGVRELVAALQNTAEHLHLLVHADTDRSVRDKLKALLVEAATALRPRAAGEQP